MNLLRGNEENAKKNTVTSHKSRQRNFEEHNIMI